MEQFQYLKEAIGTKEPDAFNFVLNVWLVWKGGRNAYLLETTNFEDPEIPQKIIQNFSSRYPETLGLVAEGDTIDTYPRLLLYRRGAVSETDVQTVASGADSDAALARLLQFGCLDPEYWNENLDRTAYDLNIKANEFPVETILVFVCSEKVTQPSTTYLRQVAGPVKEALKSTFHNVHVQWEIRPEYSLSKLVELFGEFAQGKNNIVLTDETRRNFLQVLSGDDGRGYDNLVGFFKNENLAEYQKNIKQFAPAILALLVMRFCDVGDYIGSDPTNDDPYLKRIECVESWIINWMPTK